jgi:4-aminobutyrate aminotransferase-like enzyme/Ser/Thr protein kinase RdoA (MazF antagonist)
MTIDDAGPAGDPLFDTAAPRVGPAAAEVICREVFGFEGEASPLPSERDRNFLLRGDGLAAVLKLSHSAEDRGVVEMENAAMLHVATTEPTLPIPRVLPARDGAWVTTTEGDDGRRHLTRLISVVPGEPAEGRRVSPGLAREIGAATARLSAALRGFFHPAAGRTHVWDVRHVADLERHVHAIADRDDADLVRAALAAVRPTTEAVDRLPAQVEHADVTLTNLLVQGDELTGVIDFGDMQHTASVCDLAAGLTSVLRSVASEGRAAVVESASAYLEGYQRHRPLLVEEAAALGHLVQARLVATVLISTWRAGLHPDNTEYISQYDGSSWALLRLLSDELDVAELMPRLAGTGRIVVAQQPDPTLSARRAAVFGGSLSPVSYQRPIQVARGQGAYLYDAQGRRYLDAYNNVPVVGHEHPTVVQAVASQLRVLNTNSRYLHPSSVELAERLLATTPPEAGLDTCILVNSGTEAVDLAWRIATAATGRAGALVVEHGYHGISATVADFSTNEWPPGHDPVHVATYRAPHQLPDGKHPGGPEATARVEAAAARLRARGPEPALLLLDPMFTSEGILEPGAGFLAELGSAARAAGALVLADEVQSGFGRSGPSFWAFARGGLSPDIVTLGKPMGNGYPVAAVLTRSELASTMARSREYFSTFAGGPVAAVAALTVLDVLQDNGIPRRAEQVGDYLRAELRALAVEEPMLGPVRGYGLIAGVDVGAAGAPGDPAEAARLTRQIVEDLRDRRVLVGATGPGRAVLKIRPPLIWERQHVDQLVRELRGVLADRAR